MAYGAYVHAPGLEKRFESRAMWQMAACTHKQFITGQGKIRWQVDDTAQTLCGLFTIEGMGRMFRMALGTKCENIVNQLSHVIGSMGSMASGTVF